MKLHFEEIVELIHREMHVRNGVMLGSKAAAKAILQAEEAAQQTFAPDVCHGTADGRHFGKMIVMVGVVSLAAHAGKTNR